VLASYTPIFSIYSCVDCHKQSIEKIVLALHPLSVWSTLDPQVAVNYLKRCISGELTVDSLSCMLEADHNKDCEKTGNISAKLNGDGGN
jgi:hypothetical protein